MVPGPIPDPVDYGHVAGAILDCTDQIRDAMVKRRELSVVMLRQGEQAGVRHLTMASQGKTRE